LISHAKQINIEIKTNWNEIQRLKIRSIAPFADVRLQMT